MKKTAFLTLWKLPSSLKWKYTGSAFKGCCNTVLGYDDDDDVVLDPVINYLYKFTSFSQQIYKVSIIIPTLKLRRWSLRCFNLVLSYSGTVIWTPNSSRCYEQPALKNDQLLGLFSLGKYIYLLNNCNATAVLKIIHIEVLNVIYKGPGPRPVENIAKIFDPMVHVMIHEW